MGKSITDPDAFRTILGYSPVDNVTAQAYPALFALAGLTRPARHLLGTGQMDRAAAGGQYRTAPILLKTNMEAGHGGAAGRFDRLEEVALVYIFALKTAGVIA